MRVGILGSGRVGQALGAGLIGLEYPVMMGTRDPQKPDVREWVKQQGKLASAGTFAETAAFGELLVMAVLGSAAESVIEAAGPEHFAGKVVIDATNALDFAKQPPTLFVGTIDSLGERIQRAIPQAQVVKAFNIVGAPLMVNPDLPGGPPTMFFCGNDAAAKRTVTEILGAFGWIPMDIGGIESSRYLEPMAMVWILGGYLHQNWNQAFKMLQG